MNRTKNGVGGVHVVILAVVGLAGFMLGGEPVAAGDPPGMVAIFTDPGISKPRDITAGPDGSLWFTNWGNRSIGRITSSGAVTNFTDPGILHPNGITTGPDGNLWFTVHDLDNIDTGARSVGRITPTGEVTHFTDSTMAEPYGITVGSDGNLWFTEVYNHAVGRITPDGLITHFSDPAIVTPLAITAGPDGNLWFTNSVFFGTPSIGRITPTGVVTVFTDDSLHGPTDITAGPDGAVWFTDNNWDKGTGSIGRISPTGVITSYVDPSISVPRGITAGPDGNLWFANSGDGSIGRITPDGAVSSAAGTGFAGSGAITVGPDGNLWFTNNQNDSIGRVSAGVTVPDAPTGVTGFAGDGEVAVSWAGPVSDGGSPVEAFVVTAAPGGQTCEWSSGPLTCTVPDLTNGVSYAFTVSATNAVGTGPVSAASAPVTPSACSTMGVGPYPDVSDDHPFCAVIEWLTGNGIAGGFPDGSFGPEMALTRQAMAMLLWRYAQQPAATPAEPYFADVPPGHPFYGAIQWMAESGLSSGYPNPAGGRPLYRPLGGVSRQAMAAFLWRYAQQPAATLAEPYFGDVPPGHPFYGAIQWMADSGYALGVPSPPGKPLFRAVDPVTRQAMAAFLSRYDASRT